MDAVPLTDVRDIVGAAQQSEDLVSTVLAFLVDVDSADELSFCPFSDEETRSSRETEDLEEEMER